MWLWLALAMTFWGASLQEATAGPRAADTTSQSKTLLVGGGLTPPAAIRALIGGAGGPDAPLVILTQTEEDPVVGAPLSLALFREQGATHVDAPVNMPNAQIIALLARARGVWIPGGDQNRFLTLFPEASGVPAAIRGVWKRGGVVGGTSAGASLLGHLMPTGAKTEASGLQAGACPVSDALNVLPGTIIDQHFLTRNRLLRLLTAVLEHPQNVGIGLDEGAWGVVQNNILKVGAGQVMLLCVAKPVRQEAAKLGTAGVTLSVLLPGEQASLRRLSP